MTCDRTFWLNTFFFLFIDARLPRDHASSVWSLLALFP